MKTRLALTCGMLALSSCTLEKVVVTTDGTPIADAAVPTGVGDVCRPEPSLVPADGFFPGENYFETASRQCASEVCMVYNDFAGATSLDPSESREACEARAGTACETLPTDERIADTVYCSCRCSGATTPDANCACPSGFTCVDNLVSIGPNRGGYCVREVPTLGIP